MVGRCKVPSVCLCYHTSSPSQMKYCNTTYRIYTERIIIYTNSTIIPPKFPSLEYWRNTQVCFHSVFFWKPGGAKHEVPVKRSARPSPRGRGGCLVTGHPSVFCSPFKPKPNNARDIVLIEDILACHPIHNQLFACFLFILPAVSTKCIQTTVSWDMTRPLHRAIPWGVKHSKGRFTESI